MVKGKRDASRGRGFLDTGGFRQFEVFAGTCLLSRECLPLLADFWQKKKNLSDQSGDFLV